MRLSQYFLPISKEIPKEAEILSHRLMLRGGLIKQEASGIYTWLPLGLRVLAKVQDIIREEQNKIGAHELLMPTIQHSDLWRESGRYEDYGQEMLRILDRQGRQLLYSPTNEEMITGLFRTYIRSYKDLPLILYQLQWKFRDELRPRFGVMRAREFLMKDAYSFDVDAEQARHSYNKMFIAYLRIFNRLGLKPIPMRADTGPIGGDLSHEFVILADTGESRVFFDKKFLQISLPPDDLDTDSIADVAHWVKEWTAAYAATDEQHNEREFNQISEGEKISGRGIEVGHIFYFGTKYSEPMKAYIDLPEQSEKPAHMGSYGIGISRLVGALIEAHHDDQGMIWPSSVAPFQIGLINLHKKDETSVSLCKKIYNLCRENGCDVLYDDHDERPGSKFARMDLIGLPYQVIVGGASLARGQIEIKKRRTHERKFINLDDMGPATISALYHDLWHEIKVRD